MGTESPKNEKPIASSEAEKVSFSAQEPVENTCYYVLYLFV